MELAFKMNRQNKLPIPVTSELLDCFDLVITPEECDFLLGFDPRPRTYEEILATSGLPAERCENLLETCLHKGLVWAVQPRGRPRRYVLASILVGWFELQLARGLETPREQEFARRLDRLFKTWGKLNYFPVRNVQNMVARHLTRPFQTIAPIDPEGRAPKRRGIKVDRRVAFDGMNIYTTEMVHRLLDRYPDTIAVMHCFCRQWRKMVDDPCSLKVPVDVCLVVGEFGRNVAEQGFGRQVDRKEALGILDRARKRGAVHQVFHDQDDIDQPHAAICNCCWCCCGVLGSYNRGITPLHYRCHARAVVAHADACSSCGLCARFCPTNALSVDGGEPVLDSEKCIGCGQCAYQCPEGVFRLEAGDRDVLLPVLPPDRTRLAP